MKYPLLLLLLLGSCAEMGNRAPEVFEGTDGIMRIVYVGLLLFLVAGGVSISGQGGWLKTVRNIAAIALAFLVLIVGYTYKDQLGGVYSRVKAEIVPGSPQSIGGGEVILRRDGRSGQFETTALVNGVETTFLVDTGASSVVIPYAEANRIGIADTDLNYVLQVSTANGTTFVAPIRLNALKIGDIVVNDIRAAVSKPGELESGLLGMTFLDRLEGYSVSGDLMTLKQ
jgi:aspartyl protease family protein